MITVHEVHVIVYSIHVHVNTLELVSRYFAGVF